MFSPFDSQVTQATLCSMNGQFAMIISCFQSFLAASAFSTVTNLSTHAPDAVRTAAQFWSVVGSRALMPDIRPIIGTIQAFELASCWMTEAPVRVLQQTFMIPAVLSCQTIGLQSSTRCAVGCSRFCSAFLDVGECSHQSGPCSLGQTSRQSKLQLI